MRKTMGFLLLAATAATPLAAQDWKDRGDRQEARENRGEGREVRQDRQEVRQGQREVARDIYRGDRGEARRDAADLNHDRAELGRDRRETWRDRQAVRNGVADAPAEARRDVREDRRDDRQQARDSRDWRNDRGNDRVQGRDWSGRGAAWNDRRDWSDNRNWDRRWRNDRRYGWQDYRDRNRNIYRVPRYYGPRGYAYSYRRWSPGYRIDPFFYGSGYWIDDPDYYRLPPAYGRYRWVRYYDDVLLVDITNGVIADVIYSFFWR